MSSDPAYGLQAGNASPPARIIFPSSDSIQEGQAKNVPQSSTSTSQESFLVPSKLAAAAAPRSFITDPRSGAVRNSTTLTPGALAQPQSTVPGTPLYKSSEGPAGRGNALPVRIDQPAQTGSSVGPPPPAYDRNPSHGRCLAWDAWKFARRDDGAFSENPGTDFNVPRQPRNPASSTAGPSRKP